jgi:hypothetical protein
MTNSHSDDFLNHETRRIDRLRRAYSSYLEGRWAECLLEFESQQREELPSSSPPQQERLERISKWASRILAREDLKSPAPDSDAEAFSLRVLGITVDLTGVGAHNLLKQVLPVPIDTLVGVSGSSLPTPLLNFLFGGRREPPRGTFGCFLSHARAWELSGDFPLTLICEDDVLVSSSALTKIVEIFASESWDLVFVNDRMAMTVESESDLRIMAINELPVMSLEAPGADGYLVSGRAAMELAQLGASHMWKGHVDRFLVRMSRGELGTKFRCGVSSAPAVIHTPRSRSHRRDVDKGNIL